MKPRKHRVRFFVESTRRTDFNGAHRATVTVEPNGLISVRPSRRRRVYEMPLVDVARWIIYITIRQEVAAKLAVRKKTR